jgi:predicted MFS family arabinose efflux permease
MTKTDSIFTREFYTLNALTFIAFSTVAIFFDYYQYLQSLPIDPQRFGILIGVFSVSALLLRPFLSIAITILTARKWIMASGFVLILVLILYDLASSFWMVFIVRVVHGAAYVALATAILTLLVGCIPQEKSGQAFAFFSVVTLLPYAVIPPVIEPLATLVGGFQRVLDLSGLLLILIFPLAALVNQDRIAADNHRQQHLGLREIIGNIRNHRVAMALILSLLVWTAFSPVFFFLQGFGKANGIENPGLFLTFSTIAEIAVRVVAGTYLDRMDKGKLLGLSCAWLTACYVFLAHVDDMPAVFLALGLCFGIGWGFAMPLLNGIIFDVSDYKFRSFNSNLGMQMSQMGFFVGPSLGGLILVQSGYGPLYYACGAMTMAATVMALSFPQQQTGSPTGKLG